MSTDEHKYTFAIRSLPQIGDRTLKSLITHFGSAEKAWSASEEEVLFLPKLRQEKKEAFIAGRKNAEINKIWEKFLSSEIRLLLPQDEEYPKLLRQIPDYPQTLYVRGNFDWKKNIPMIAIVGSRKFTSYGEQVASQLATGLTNAGFLVVSGLAFGIDSIAHKSALDAGGETLAVLGSGIDDSTISPATHIPLARKITEHGALLAEYPPGLAGTQGSFVVRNRIIAGMTLGTIIIEAAEQSGSLVTARLALEYNREVFAVPGSIFSPASIGTNGLLKRGAKIVCGIQDILEEFSDELLSINHSSLLDNVLPENLTTEEILLLSNLSHEPLHIDKIIKITKLQTAHASSLLAVMEIKGLAKDIGGMHYIRT